MRKLVGVALAAAAILVLLLIIPPAANPAAAKQAAAREGGLPAPFSLGIYSSEISDSGNGTVAVLQMFATGGSDEKVFAYCSDLPLADSILILDHPAVPGMPYGFPAQIARAVEKCGFSYNVVAPKDALSWENAIIMAPTGAFPQSLGNESARMEDRNLRLIVAESLPGRTVSQNGTIGRQEQPPADYERVEIAPSQESAAISGMAEASLASRKAAPVEVIGRGGNLTAAIPVGSGQAIGYCRIYQFSNSSCRFSDSGKITKPKGALHAKAVALAGEDVDFEFSLGNQEGGRRLVLYAVDYSGRNEAARKEVADGVVSSGWAGRFSLKLAGEGRHTIWLVDQFGRRHASAFVDVQGFSAELSKRSGNRLEFIAAFGGEPLTGTVVAWIDNGEKKQFRSNNGTLAIWASPAPGMRTLHLSYLGIELEKRVVFEESQLGNYLRLLVPSLLFLLAIFLLLRAGSRVKYRITFPEFAQGGREEIAVGKADLALAWKCADAKLGAHGLMASPDEIGKCLAKSLEKTGAVKAGAISSQSLQRALGKLASEGVFLESEGMFIPAKEAGGFSAGQHRCLRLAHDLLLEQGVRFARKKVVPAKKLGLEIAVFTDEKSVLAGIGRLRRIVLFVSESQLASFRKSLCRTSEEAVRVKIAEQNGKVVFTVAERHALEAALR